MKKETAAQRIERIKIEKDGLAVLEDIKQYAASNTEIDPEDIDRFKWYGLYTQNKNLQADTDNTLYFMLRIKLEHGSMNTPQMRCISQISREFAQDTADFTTRQDIQLHFIKVVDLPEIFKRLNNVGLSTVFAAGDVPRNVATCPVSGIEEKEIFDTTSLANEINDYLRGNHELVNLPRKYKIGISGCHKHCIGHEIQDLSFTAVKIDGEVLFAVTVGGGLGSNKKIALHLGYIFKEQVLDTVKTITIIYRDYGLRDSRRKARLGHLIDEWGLEKFKAFTEEKLGFAFIEKPIQEYMPYARREHFGIHKSTIVGKSYVGCAVNGGTIGSYGLNNLADILEKYNASTIKVTNTQNFIILDVPHENTEKLAKALLDINIEANPSPFKARTISCTGINFCKFAVSETKYQATWLASYLEQRFPDFDEHVSISLNGCPNSCAHPHVVDIGLMGAKVKDEEGNSVAGFELILGGNLEGEVSNFGFKTAIKILPKYLNRTVERIIEQYINSGQNGLHRFLKENIENENFIESLREVWRET
ncbi:nitrite/sulfite reductase [Sulfurovum sp. zt1-1]|uniref:Nitrite/sulfite reductase n=1 Tax=Sulfurovum zhangzhouensis TaxID=3019067 RepID=A0ABT7R103_9BACT|nr:nitrite/sulfite reductase [Sulfurovum zhangzhouensis]MDM5272758.1 nitrite/sulfite reductase [Sulfurovum zhangzhouensis]